MEPTVDAPIAEMLFNGTQYSQLDDSSRERGPEGTMGLEIAQGMVASAPFASQFSDEFFGYTPDYSTLEDVSVDTGRVGLGEPPVSLYSHDGFAASNTHSESTREQQGQFLTVESSVNSTVQQLFQEADSGSSSLYAPTAGTDIDVPLQQVGVFNLFESPAHALVKPVLLCRCGWNQAFKMVFRTHTLVAPATAIMTTIPPTLS